MNLSQKPYIYIYIYISTPFPSPLGIPAKVMNSFIATACALDWTIIRQQNANNPQQLANNLKLKSNRPTYS